MCVYDFPVLLKSPLSLSIEEGRISVMTIWQNIQACRWSPGWVRSAENPKMTQSCSFSHLLSLSPFPLPLLFMVQVTLHLFPFPLPSLIAPLPPFFLSCSVPLPLLRLPASSPPLCLCPRGGVDLIFVSFSSWILLRLFFFGTQNLLLWLECFSKQNNDVAVLVKND